MSFSKKQRTVVYIVRIWAEYLDESPPQWRGVIAPIGEAKSIHFSTLDEMIDLIQKKTQSLIEKENKS
jgi:hypothetical protein